MYINLLLLFCLVSIIFYCYEQHLFESSMNLSDDDKKKNKLFKKTLKQIKVHIQNQKI